MGWLADYGNSIKSSFSSSSDSLKRAGDDVKGNNPNIAGKLFNGLGNLITAGIHAAAGLAKIALPIAAGVALVAAGPVGWGVAVGCLGAIALSSCGGDPTAPKVNGTGAEQPKDGTTPPPAGDGAAPPPPAGDGAPPNNGAPETFLTPAKASEAAEAAIKAAGKATEAAIKVTTVPAKDALIAAETELNEAATALSDPNIDKAKAAAKKAATAAKVAEAAAKKANEGKKGDHDPIGGTALTEAAKELAAVAKALNAIAPKPAVEKPANGKTPPVEVTEADKGAAERVNTLITELSEKVDSPTYDPGLLYDADTEYGKLTETQQKLIPPATKEKLTKLLAQVA